MLVLTLGGLCTPAFAQKRVFAHYMVTNQDYQGNTDPTQQLKIAAYEREIQQAQAAGIDGFALNVGGWLNQNYYIVYSAQMFAAAVRLNTGFKLMFSADMCCGNAMADVEDLVRRFANDPRYSQAYFTQSQNSNPGVPAVNTTTNFGPVADVIYVTANLAAAATLKVTSGSQVLLRSRNEFASSATIDVSGVNAPAPQAVYLR
jgi:hypothetical protein